MKFWLCFLCAVCSSIIFSGCGTMFNGAQDPVMVVRSNGARIYDVMHGKYVQSVYENKDTVVLMLDRADNHLLRYEYEGKVAYSTIRPVRNNWAIVDVVGLPFIYPVDHILGGMYDVSSPVHAPDSASFTVQHHMHEDSLRMAAAEFSRIGFFTKNRSIVSIGGAVGTVTDIPPVAIPFGNVFTVDIRVYLSKNTSIGVEMGYPAYDKERVADGHKAKSMRYTAIDVRQGLGLAHLYLGAGGGVTSPIKTVAKTAFGTIRLGMETSWGFIEWRHAAGPKMSPMYGPNIGIDFFI